MQLHPSGYWEGAENTVTSSFVFWNKIKKILRNTTNSEKILRKIGKPFVKTVTDAPKEEITTCGSCVFLVKQLFAKVQSIWGK